MKTDMVTKAVELRQRGNIRRDQQGNFAVPSSSSDATYLVSKDGLCNCPAMKSVCSHNLAAFNACTVIQQFRWCEDYDILLVIADVHIDALSQMPPRIREFCRQEFSNARRRIFGEQSKAA
jgi:hypothetical protein